MFLTLVLELITHKIHNRIKWYIQAQEIVGNNALCIVLIRAYRGQHRKGMKI
jgi:hypothetical protein